MKTKIFYIVLIIASVISISCKRNCDKTLDKFSQHEAFNYFAFDGGSWHLSGNGSSLSLDGFYVSGHGKMYNSIEKCKTISILTGYTCSFSDSINPENDFSFNINNDYQYNKKFNDVSLFINQTNDTYSKELPFDITNTSMNNDDIQLYFIPSLTIKGVTYNDVAVQYFNSSDTVIYVEKLFVAPYVGPVRFDLNDGRTFELDSTNSTIVSVDFFN